MIRFGICGCGGFIERAILPMMQKVENVKPIAAFTLNKQRLQEVCNKFGIKKACFSFEDLIAVPEVDVIYIASPNVFHRDQAIAAAKAGKHIFCQKPMGINTDECKEMIAACRENNVKLGVGFCYRFGGAQQKVKEMIRDGLIGDVSYIYLSFNLSGYKPETAGWRCDPKKAGGGPLMDLAPHLIDLAGFFLGDKVESVMAYVKPQRTDTMIETDVLAIMEFNGGAKASMDISFVQRGNMHNYTLVGSKGEIHAVGTMPWLTNGRKAGRLTCEINSESEKEVEFPTYEHIEQEIRLYCQAIEEGKDPPVPGEAGLNAQAVIDAIYESGQTGKCCMVKY